MTLKLIIRAVTFEHNIHTDVKAVPEKVVSRTVVTLRGNVVRIVKTSWQPVAKISPRNALGSIFTGKHIRGQTRGGTEGCRFIRAITTMSIAIAKVCLWNTFQAIFTMKRPILCENHPGDMCPKNSTALNYTLYEPILESS